VPALLPIATRYITYLELQCIDLNTFLFEVWSEDSGGARDARWAQQPFNGGGCDGKGPLFVLYPGASTERGRHLLPQSHNFRLDFGWIAAEDAVKEVRIDGIEAVAETDDGRGDVQRIDFTLARNIFDELASAEVSRGLDHSDLVGEVLHNVKSSAVQVEPVAVRKQLLSAFDLEGRCLTAFRVDQVKNSAGNIHDHELSAVKISDETVGVETGHLLEARHGDHFDHRGRGKASVVFKDYLVQVRIEGVRE